MRRYLSLQLVIGALALYVHTTGIPHDGCGGSSRSSSVMCHSWSNCGEHTIRRWRWQQHLPSVQSNAGRGNLLDGHLQRGASYVWSAVHAVCKVTFHAWCTGLRYVVADGAMWVSGRRAPSFTTGQCSVLAGMSSMHLDRIGERVVFSDCTCGEVRSGKLQLFITSQRVSLPWWDEWFYAVGLAWRCLNLMAQPTCIRRPRSLPFIR